MPWFVVSILISILFGGFGGAYFGYSAGEKSVQQRWDNYARKQAESQIAYVEQTRKQEAQLQKTIDELQKDNSNARQIIASRDASLRDSLRNRPQRTNQARVSENTGSAQAAEGCTAAQLFRQDADAFVGEASRAETIRVELLSCYSAIDAIRNSYVK